VDREKATEICGNISTVNLRALVDWVIGITMKRRKKFLTGKTVAARLSKTFRINIAVNPFKMAAIISAITVVSWVIIILGWKIIISH
jgi:hypothetical protein